MRRRSVLLALASIGMATAETPGVPDYVRPGTMPRLWVNWTNDAFGGEIGSNFDDFRTNAVNANYRWDRVLVAIDHAQLTAKTNLSKSNGSRLDEVSLALGYVLLNERDRQGHRYHAAVGIGARYSGEAGGEGIQNGWHRIIGVEPLDLPYDETDELDAYGWWQANGLLSSSALFDVPVITFAGAGSWGLTAETSGRYLSNDEVQADIGSRLMLLGNGGALWAGVRRTWRNGDLHSRTSELVAANEDGGQVIYGITAGCWFVEGSWNWDTEASMGRVGLSWGRETMPPSGNEQVVVGEFGTTFGSAGLGGQLRWQPEMFADRPVLDDSTFFLDLRFGAVAGLDIPDNDAISQQFLFGLDWTPWAYSHPGCPCRFETLVQAGAGLRIESLEADGPSPTFDDHQAISPVIQGAIGARIWWGNEVGHNDTQLRYGLSCSYDAWLPLAEKEIGNGSETLRLNRGDQGVSLRLMTAVLW